MDNFFRNVILKLLITVVAFCIVMDIKQVYGFLIGQALILSFSELDRLFKVPKPDDYDE